MSDQLHTPAPHHLPLQVAVNQLMRPAGILVPEDGLDGVTPGSSCIVNACTGNHEEISASETSTSRPIALHVVDGAGLVHALLLRIQALLLPIRTLVLSGH